ncbi:MAG: fibronectin type III domain-containing protein, partial [Bacteroidota bacterium]
TAGNITTSAARITWSGTNANSYNLRYRRVGQTAWTNRNTSTASYNLTGLNDATNYEVQVRSVCQTGTSNYSSSLNFQTDAVPQPCNAPGSLSVSSISTNSATITWGSVTTANSYTLRYRRSGTSSWTQVSTANRSRTLSGLTTGTTYQVQIRSNCSGQSSAYSAIQTFTTNDVCNIPSNLSLGSLNTTSALLSWNTVSGALAYTFRYRRVGTSAWTQFDIASTSFGINNLLPNTNYEAQVRTLCQNNATSGYSNSINFRTQANQSPTGCNETVNSNGFESTWGIWNDGGSDASRIFDPSKATGNYSVRLRDNTASSVMVSDPIDLSNYNAVEFGFSFITISFDDNTERFVLEMADNSATFQEIQAWTYQTNFTNNGPYDAKVNIPGPFTDRVRFRIRCDASANDDLVYIDNVTINACTGGGNPPEPEVCDSPSNLSVAGIAHSQATVSWNAQSAAQSYRLRYRAIGSVSWQNITTNNTSYTLNALSSETNYEVQVSSICAIGTSNYTSSRTFRTEAIPLSCSIPGGLQISSTSTSGAQIIWSTVAGAVSYSVRYRRSGTTTWTTRTTSSTVYNIAGLSSETSYQVQVRANCNGDQSNYSTSRTFTTEAEVLVCNVPQNLNVVNIQTLSATVNWSASTVYQSYTIRFRRQGISNWTTLSRNGSSLILSFLIPDTDYEVQIRGRCLSGDYSNYSSSLAFKTLPQETVPDAPGDCNVNVNTNDFERTWGIWNDGGTDSRRTFNPARANGNYSVQLRDNSSSSVTVCDPLDLSSYKQIEFSFTFIAEGFISNSEGLILEQSIDFGPYEKIKEWKNGQGFLNNQRVNENFVLDQNLTSRVRYRFRTTGNSNDQKIHIDDIQMLGCPKQIGNSVAIDQTTAATSTWNLNKATVVQHSIVQNTEASVLYNLEVFPNPAKERLYIQIRGDEWEQFQRIMVFNMSGQLVLQKRIDPVLGYLQESIEVQDLTKGIYLVRVLSEQGSYQQRFVVQ